MSLRFLSPGPSPSPRSPLAEVAERAGATLQLRDGWIVPARFDAPDSEMRTCREDVGWADASHLGKLELVRDRQSTGAARRDENGWWCPLTPTRSLLLCAWPNVDELHERHGRDALDVTTQLAALRLVGPAARELLARFCAIDLRPSVSPPGAFAPGSLARTPGYVLCEAPDRYLLLFGSAYAQYIWTVVCDAGRHLGGRPVGVDAISEEVASHA